MLRTNRGKDFVTWHHDRWPDCRLVYSPWSKTLVVSLGGVSQAIGTRLDEPDDATAELVLQCEWNVRNGVSNRPLVREGGFGTLTVDADGVLSITGKGYWLSSLDVYLIGMAVRDPHPRAARSCLTSCGCGA